MSHDPYEDMQKVVLSSGLTIYCLEQDKPFFTMRFAVHAGSREEPAGKDGLAHFAEHMVSGNIPGYPDYLENVKFFRDTGGGAMFGRTNYYSTKYGFSLPADESFLARGIDMFAHMFYRPSLVRDLDKERAIIDTEYWRKYKNPAKVAFKIAPRKMLLGNHRLANSCVLGTPQTIATFEYPDIQAFVDQYYVPANVTLVCVGGISLRQLIELLAVTPLAKGITERNPAYLAYPTVDVLTPSERVVKAKARDLGEDSELVSYEAAWILPQNIAREAIDATRNALSQLLFKEVREERQLAYHISAHWYSLQDLRVFGIKGELNPSCVEDIDNICRGIVHELSEQPELLREQVDRELKRIKFHDLSTEATCNWIIDSVADTGSYTTLQEDRERLEGITQKDFDQIFEILLGPKTVSSIVAP